jgi:hypothetical protein
MSSSRSVFTIMASLCALSGFAVTGASGYATIAPPPSPSAGSGLPDGRVYEQASPSNKHGYQAGALGRSASEPLAVFAEFSVASPDGNAVRFSSAGPAAETDSSGLSRDFVAEHATHGWTSRSTTARGLGQNERISAFLQKPVWLDYSLDLSHLAYSVVSADIPAAAAAAGSANFYLLGSNPLEEPAWLLRGATKASLEEPKENELVGMSPDAGIVYIAYDGRLLPQDASRSGWGLYEYRDGVLSEAGLLPDGGVPASGALPVATSTAGAEHSYGIGQNNPASLDNQVSEDGMRVFFVSSGELYVHQIEADESERSVLVSASQLPGHVGEAAPDGATLFANLTKNSGPLVKNSAPTYAYASPDGSHAFFQSEDQLTSGAPGGAGSKVYDFDVDTGSLEYLPGVTLGGIVTAAKDGSSFAFVNGTGSNPDLDLWSSGPNGGSVNQIAQLPGGGFVGPGRIVADSSVFVFQASAPIAGFNNVGGEQIYRYDMKTSELECVSCPPAGGHPSGNAYLSAIDQYESPFGLSLTQFVVNDVRGVSSDGKRIFFDSPDPLVSRDTNGYLDAYEWENGKLFLISSGTSSDYSLFLDNSESGDDVFFATSDELVQGDNDSGFDVYDARVPRPGDNPPPSAVPCSGDVCQGPPNIAQLLGSPPSATFSGAENVVYEQPASKAKSSPKRLTRAQKLAGSLGECHKRKSKHKRAVCEKQARKRYPAVGKGAKHDSRRGK